jgi:SAM-dependent methyltransferase
VKLPESGWFNPIAEFLGSAYWAPDSTKVQAFTTGTEQEVEFLVGRLGLESGMRVLDAGCGPGRHSFALARRGINVVGVDLSPDFIALAQSNAGDLPVEFQLHDVRELPFENEFDAVVCLCQGAFGLMTADGDDGLVVAGMARALRDGGRLALSAFNSYFAVRYHEEASFDAATGVSHERTDVRSESGEVATVDLWTGCYTPRELRLLLGVHELRVDSVSSVEPGAYAFVPATTESPEFLVLATRLPRKMEQMSR